MNVEAFLAWAEDRPGRYELLDGEIVAMAPARVRHAATKFAVQTALRAIDAPCRMLPDGMSVRIDAQTVFEPDALVYCGARLPLEAVTVPEPVIVVEILSLGTRRVDTGRKLSGYVQVPSVRHDLIVDAERRTVIHHRRADGDLIETRILAAGTLSLDPPGLSLPLAALFEEP